MTFAQKLQTLRKQHKWTQEELAEKIAVSRQALSKWESGAVLPDTENIIQLSRLFHVSTDFLLLDEMDSDRQKTVFPETVFPETGKSEPESSARNTLRIAAGSCTLGLSLLGLLILGILSSVFPAFFVVSPADASWVRMYSGLWGFLKTHNLEWLFVLCIAAAVAGIGILFLPCLKKRFLPRLRAVRTLFRKSSDPEQS